MISLTASLLATAAFGRGLALLHNFEYECAKKAGNKRERDFRYEAAMR